MEKVTIDNVCYELNAKNRTAVIVKGKCEGNIVIPDNITHRDIVYIIKGVGESAFYNTRTKFTKTEDSKMQMIISPISSKHYSHRKICIFKLYPPYFNYNSTRCYLYR